LCGAADGSLCVRVEVGECGELFAGLLIRQRIRENGVLGQLGIGSVVLPHQEELS
jgi:hypothetical protein